jgi:hypothetical protein
MAWKTRRNKKQIAAFREQFEESVAVSKHPPELVRWLNV